MRTGRTGRNVRHAYDPPSSSEQHQAEDVILDEPLAIRVLEELEGLRVWEGVLLFVDL